MSAERGRWVGQACSVDGCESDVLCRGWCNRHYKRWKFSGDPEGGFGRSVEERFWGKVDKAGPVPTYRPDLGPCWIWTAGQRGKGYGKFREDGSSVSAHRWAYESEHGPIPDGLHIDHLCRVHPCVNPRHLEAVTGLENMERGEVPWMRARRAGACLRGHEWNEVNTYIRPDGNHVCRVCVRITYANRVKTK